MPMWFLPSLSGEDGTPRRWPLMRETADALAEALLCEPAEREKVVRAALARDPVLAEWTAERGRESIWPASEVKLRAELAGEIDARTPRDDQSTLERATAWLAANLACELVWATPDDFCVELPTEKNTARGISRRLPQLAEKVRQVELLQAEMAHRVEQLKLEALKNFAYGAGHELNNPLANIATRAQTLLKEETNPERRRRLAAINAQAFRAHEMIADLMLFARPPKLAPRNVKPRELIGVVLDKLSEDATGRGTALVQTTADSAAHCEISVDPVQLSVALREIVVNALQAVGAGGRVEVEVRFADRLPDSKTPAANALRLAVNPPEQIQIIVTDTGPGIPPDVRPHLFDPFYSGREAGRGLGFGLCKAWRIVTDHGGRIDVASEPGKGATFIISLPTK